MSLEIMRDPRVRSVEWRDLVPVNRFEIFKELTLIFPWLTGSLLLANAGYYHYLPAMAMSFVFFLTGLRVSHNAQHYAMGISRKATEWVLYALSVIMLSSMHAVQVTHLHHHKHCLDDEDVEAMCAKMSGWKAMLVGPYFPYLIHKTALKIANPKQRRWVIAEMISMVVWIGIVLAFLPYKFMLYHVIVMLVGQCFTGFFAVWTVHHDCEPNHFIARTLRGPIRRVLTFHMFYHVEHHLFPRVPTCHLNQLAERLDEAAPELQQMRVF